eukprot:2701005-Amphidinium_carterae.1
MPSSVPGQRSRKVHQTGRSTRTFGRALLELTVKSAKAQAAAGPDWWRATELKSLPDVAHAMMACLYNAMEDKGSMVRPLRRGWQRPIPKSGHTASALAIRPITVLSQLHRNWSSIRYRHLQTWAEAVLAPAQAAYRKNRSTKLELHALLSRIGACAASGTPAYIGQLDLSKAYPRLNKSKARQIAVASGMPIAFADYVYANCLSKELSWKIRGVETEPAVTRRGTPQGCSLSILMFQVTLAPVVHALQRFLTQRCPQAVVMVYADDIVFLTPSTALLAEVMQYAATLLWSLDFEVNVDKSAVSA